MKLSSITRISDTFGKGIIPFFEIGYILLYMTFLQTVVISFILILIPLIIWKLYKFSKYDSLKINIGNKIGTFLYFSGIGFGYIFLEIVFVQYFNLYLGNIIYSTSMVISLMLISSGLGSYFSDRITINRNNITPVFVTILILLILLYFFLLTIIKSTVTYSLFIKILISILIIFPPSFLMGIPFPHGIKYLGVANEDLIPWGWGINGVFSVIGVVLATIISVEIGQSWLILLTAFAYSLPMFTKFAVKKNAPILS